MAEFLGRLNWCSAGSPSKLYHAGQIVTSPARLADIMNNFFVTKVVQIQQGLPAPTDDPLKTLKEIMKNRTTTFSLATVHPDSVRKIILGLKNSKSIGEDNIYTYIIKLMVEDILPAVTHIFPSRRHSFHQCTSLLKSSPYLRKMIPWKPKIIDQLQFSVF